MAVSAQEGLGGGIGDYGTSFGPFQLHWGGAYPSFAPQGNPQAAQAWAWSPTGIDYALGQIQQVAGGLRGPAAVTNIVSRFERPANIPGEISGALRAYGAPLPAPSASYAPAAPPAPVTRTVAPAVGVPNLPGATAPLATAPAPQARVLPPA